MEEDSVWKELCIKLAKLEKENSNLRESQLTRERWISDRKRELGYSQQDSFDKVWEQTIARANYKSTVKPLQGQEGSALFDLQSLCTTRDGNLFYNPCNDFDVERFLRNHWDEIHKALTPTDNHP